MTHSVKFTVFVTWLSDSRLRRARMQQKGRFQHRPFLIFDGKNRPSAHILPVAILARSALLIQSIHSVISALQAISDTSAAALIRSNPQFAPQLPPTIPAVLFALMRKINPYSFFRMNIFGVTARTPDIESHAHKLDSRLIDYIDHFRGFECICKGVILLRETISVLSTICSAIAVSRLLRRRISTINI